MGVRASLPLRLGLALAYMVVCLVVVLQVRRARPLAPSEEVSTTHSAPSDEASPQRLHIESTYAVAQWTVLLDSQPVQPMVEEPFRFEGAVTAALLEDGGDLMVSGEGEDLLSEAPAALRVRWENGAEPREETFWGVGAVTATWTLGATEAAP